MFVADGEEFDDLGEYSTAIGVDQARDHLVGDVSCRSAQHFLELRCRKALNYDIFLGLFGFILSLEVKRVVVVQRVVLVDLRKVRVHVLLSQVDVLQQSLPSLLHLYEATL